MVERGLWGGALEGRAMDNEATESTISISSMEMLSIGGFGLMFAWLFVCLFRLFCEYPPDVASATRDLTQLFAFAAMPLGFLVLHFRAKESSFNLFSKPMVICSAAFAVVQPVVALVMYQGVDVPIAIVCVANFLAGCAAASINLAWLDVGSRLNLNRHNRFTGLSLFAGGLLFVLVAFGPAVMQPVFGLVFVLASVGLLVYSTRHAPGNDTRAPLESIANPWQFAKEIEPSFFMFGVVFALTFVFLFNNGSEAVLLGLISSLVGSLVVVVLSIADRELSIIVFQRILVVITVASCIVLPFVETAGQIVCSCVVVAAWAMFKAVNQAFIIKKSVIAHDAPLFRQAPLRLFFPSCGFACGWVLAAVFTFAFGVHSDVFIYLRLGVAIVLVLTIMVFFPDASHHPVDGQMPAEQKVTTTVITVDKSESELFEARCAAVAKLYQLSPRESEILVFLAKGRNAAYIQEELVISPHTVKSHIYNIYRKLDIHSQQKLMDFVEEFPLDDRS